MTGYRLMALGVLLLLPSSTWSAQVAPASPGWVEIEVASPSQRPVNDEAAVAAGREIYNIRCSSCHGIEGDGEGPVAPYLDPRPRNFLFANFKFRTTTSGELPLEEDLFRTITRGIPGTAMPSWKPLPEEQRWQVVYYIKHLARDWFDDEELDPRRTGEEGETFVMQIPAPPPASQALIERGKAAFARAKCQECHGDRTLGNGTSAGRQFNYLKERILPADLTKGWNYKGGSRPEDIWKTLTLGLNGTPMPSFIDSFNAQDPQADADDRWAVAHYIHSIARSEPDSSETVLRAHKVSGLLPRDPGDAAWETAHEISFRLFGQVTRRPRWQIPAIDHVQVRALYSDTEIAIRLEYHDRTRSEQHEDPDILNESTSYPLLDVSDYAHNRVSFRDAVALQFPVKPVTGAVRPYFLYGQMDRPVNLWRFLADRDPDRAFEEVTARGPEKIVTQPEEDQDLGGIAEYVDGVWRVVFRRPLASASPKSDVQFVPGSYVPFSVMAWDGGWGESGLRQSLSSWYGVVLEAPTPPTVYYRAGLGALVVLFSEFFLLWRSRRHPGRSDR